MDNITDLTKELEQRVGTLSAGIRAFVEKIRHLPLIYCHKRKEVIEPAECSKGICEFANQCPLGRV